MGCSEYQGYRTSKGYGLRSRNGKINGAHRHAWEEAYGPIPESMQVLHRCDNRACVNPRHLFLGTNADNMEDRNTKGRQAKGERMGASKLTEADVLEIFEDRRPLRAIAGDYGVSHKTIFNIKKGLTWTYLRSTISRPS